MAANAPRLFPLPSEAREAFASDRATCFGWKALERGEVSFVVQRYGWGGVWKVVERWPATAEGWDAAWSHLLAERPQLAAAVAGACADGRVDAPGEPVVDRSAPARGRDQGLIGRLQAIPGFEFVLTTLLSTRMLVWVVSLLGLHLIGNPDQPTPFHVGTITNLFAVSARWDSLWYLQVAQHGYSTLASTNFYPLLPLLIHVTSWVVRIPVLAGLLISWVCALGAGLLLYQLTALDYGEVVARRVVLLLFLSPMAVFLTAVYTEPLFLMLTIGCFYAARRERWWLAGLLAALASATRPPGILLALPLALMFFYGPRQQPGKVRGWLPRYRFSASALSIALAGAGLLAYLVYCQVHVHNFFEPFDVQQLFWTHYDTFPFGGLIDALGHLPGDLSAVFNHTGKPFGPGDPISWTAHELIDLAFVIPTVWLLIAGWRSLPFAYTAYVLVNLALVLSTPTHFELMQSFDRYTLVLFPLLITAGRSWMRGPFTRVLTLSVSSGLMCFFAAWFGAGKWVA